jgi:hypothetical protein
MLVVDPCHYGLYGWVLLREIMFENSMDRRVIRAVNLPSYHSICWISVSLIPDKQYVKLASCSLVIWEHDCPMNDVSTVLSSVDNRLLCIKDSTNTFQNSCLLDYMTMKLIFGSILPLADTNMMMACIDVDIRKSIVSCCCMFWTENLSKRLW